MTGFETSSRRGTGENNKPNFFQRLGKSKSPEAVQTTEKTKEKPFKKLGEILKRASTPREKELAQAHQEIKKETHGLLSNLSEKVETTKKENINIIRKSFTKNSDNSKNPDAVRPYQQDNKATGPQRFRREIGTVDGGGEQSHRAYEADKRGPASPEKRQRPGGMTQNEGSEKPQEETKDKLKLQKGFRGVPLRFQGGLNKLIAERKRNGIEISEKNPVAIYDSSSKKLMLWDNGRMKILSATHGKGKLGDDTPRQYGTPRGAAAILEGSSRVGSSAQDVLGGNGAIVGANIHIDGLESQNNNMLGRTVRIHGLPENYANTNGCIGVMPQDVSKLMEWTRGLGQNPNQAYLYIT